MNKEIEDDFNLAPDKDVLITSKYRALLFNTTDVQNNSQISFIFGTNNYI